MTYSHVLQLMQCLDDIDLLFISHFPYHILCLIMSYSVFSHLSSHISHINQFVHFLMKPWGYAGAPEHPYGEEWWKMLDETMWKGYRTSEAFRKLRNKRLTDAIKSGKELFEDRVRAATESK